MSPGVVLDMLAGLGGRSTASSSSAASRHGSTRGSGCRQPVAARSTARSPRSTRCSPSCAHPRMSNGKEIELMIRKSGLSRSRSPLIAGDRGQVAARHRALPEDPGDVGSFVARYRIVPEQSQVLIDARSSLHPDPHAHRRARRLARPGGASAAVASNSPCPRTAKLSLPVDACRRATRSRTVSCGGASTPGASRRSTASSPSMPRDRQATAATGAGRSHVPRCDQRPTRTR